MPSKTHRCTSARNRQAIHIRHHSDRRESAFPEHLSAIVNLWRPIHYPATNNALAVRDARTVPESHLRSLTAIFPKENQTLR
ncbi:hypothetical protein AC579_8327 [Pseudocercospora musae]|uniref:Uncharacterized protein n=1 Tax=Pseudocercospora musae TaxID=113226 RepID=A0A139I7D4_9PEZI|nr:hypothetical protein AC579_8327 [Pseudocercospora musae]